MTHKDWKLKRTKQCAKCPWKKSTNPYDIPDGYSKELHHALIHTIAEPGKIDQGFTAMSCHEADVGEEVHCIGWVHQQAGVGNNIGLRLRLMTCSNTDEITIDGEQHTKFEDTLP